MVKEKQKQKEEEEKEEEEDDYMNMAIADPVPVKESSFARAQRLKAESAARGVIKSKAQLKEEEEAARERALSTSMLDDARAKKSKGFAMMAKMGFSGGGLGKKNGEGRAGGRTEPIALTTKEDRGGIGLENERKRKAAEAAAAAAGNGDGVSKAARLDPMEYRDRVRKEREDEKLERQFYAAQRMAERLDDEKTTATAGTAGGDGGADKVTPMAGRPLKSIPVLYRGLVKHRMEGERSRRMRHDLEQSLSSRLPTYDDPDEDDDYRKALGKGGNGNKAMVYAEDEELDEEDEELDRFGEKEARERLRAGLEYLRREHRYCFWCKSKYDDEDMEGCPGVDEEDHD
ncbi:hypothetical protein N3K66_001263 [Trichothecium roseum]|uniref:Uncharacterized protein n=1 Tax=Trichothecium roseum TaxID=47278 RepID=A0ACC0VEA1_9HYPO|nr:hypothetical protein N3K66_001263 [Trichothecium roseum]